MFSGIVTAMMLGLDPEIRVANVHKVSQITGEMDRERGTLTDNRTESQYGLRGTDLGAVFEHEGRLVVLFGDTHPSGGNTPDRPFDGKAIAFSNDTNPEDGLTLNFLTAADGLYRTVQVPGVSLNGFEVPNGGFSHNGSMYAFYTTDHTRADRGEVMGRSVLVKSKDSLDWKLVYSLSTDKYVNVSSQIVDAAKTPGLPFKTGKALLMWAGGREYRRSSPCFAAVPLAHVEDKSAIRYWVSPGEWSQNEADAKPLFVHPEVGELSVTYCKPIRRWIMLYNSNNPRGIQLRTAKDAVGPWTEPVIVFHPSQGHGKFMHQPGKDHVNDPGRENDFSGEYGPFVIPRFDKKVPGGARIYFLMSIWNPYNVVLMRADLLLKS